MSSDIARSLMDLTVWLASARQRPWALAMRRELDEAADPLGWAAGCFTATVSERLRPMQTFITAGRLLVAAVTAAYAAFHFKMAWNGAKILMGGPDWYYDKLIAWGHPDLAQAHQEMVLYIFLFMLLIGITHLGAAVFLVRWRPKVFFSFVGAGALVLLVFIIPFAVQGAEGAGSATALPFQALPIVLLAVAALALGLLGRKGAVAGA